MRVFTPGDITEDQQSQNKYLGVLVAAKYARVLNEFPKMGNTGKEKKLTTRALEDLHGKDFDYRVMPRRRPD
jgi:DNA-directed RNA polymerase subunit K/omega